MPSRGNPINFVASKSRTSRESEGDKSQLKVNDFEETKNKKKIENTLGDGKKAQAQHGAQ